MPEIEPAIQSNGDSKTMFDNTIFGKYELGRLLGCGAFAKVYHARNVKTGQSVAVKVIGKKKIAGTNLMSNIKREITIMRCLRHPNIVRLHEVLATQTKIYFVMDIAKGGELFAKVAKGRFSEDLARRYFRQLISAVGYCHARGVCHRDLKPENLLLDEHGDLRVSDFGLSAVKESVRTDGLLHTLCGTPAYVAPEILTKKGYEGAKVDVWSCGVILFVLTAGFLPFNDPNLMNMYKKIYKGEYRCPKWMSSDLKRFLSRVLDTNPKTRITIDEITKDPWFKMGGYEDLIYLPESLGKDEESWDTDDDDVVDDESKSKNGADEGSCSYAVNAFDLISFSVGLDLSGLIDESRSPLEDVERFLSKLSPQLISKKIECLAMAANLSVRKWKKKDRVGVDLIGLNGNIVVKMEMGQLTDELVVVEVRRRAGDATLFNDLWKNKIRLEIDDLVYRGDDQQQMTLLPPDNDGHKDDVSGVI